MCDSLFFVVFVLRFLYCVFVFFFFKQKTAYEMRISDWSSDVCSSDLGLAAWRLLAVGGAVAVTAFTFVPGRDADIFGRAEHRLLQRQLHDEAQVSAASPPTPPATAAAAAAAAETVAEKITDDKIGRHQA